MPEATGRLPLFSPCTCRTARHSPHYSPMKVFGLKKDARSTLPLRAVGFAEATLAVQKSSITQTPHALPERTPGTHTPFPDYSIYPMRGNRCFSIPLFRMQKKTRCRLCLFLCLLTQSLDSVRQPRHSHRPFSDFIGTASRNKIGVRRNSVLLKQASCVIIELLTPCERVYARQTKKKSGCINSVPDPLTAHYEQ